MRRVGLIDNLSHIDAFLAENFHRADSASVMVATGGNTGNVAFVFGVRRMIDNPITRMSWDWDPTVVRDRFDSLVVCCANQIGHHVDLGGWADRLEQFRLPITLVGLGAQSDDIADFPEIPGGTTRFLELVRQAPFAESDTNIAVRGTFTEEILARMGTTSMVVGCPSLMISEETRLGEDILKRQSNAAFEKVATAAGNPWHSSSAFLERELLQIVHDYRGAYILQHPESMVQIAFGEREHITPETAKRFLETYGAHFDLDGLLNWYRQHAYVFVDVPNWMRFLSHFDAVIGPRYHGVALGVQVGIPGCVVTIDSRTEELCDATCIKSHSIDDAKLMNSDELVQAIRWTDVDANLFDANRTEKARMYVDFLSKNGLAPSQHLISISRGS